ncbi:hypothetical protein ACFXG4_08515 [Nocardia sp. NPDC059246]|uniref:hypothetical protein n=1 Tax=unclassified Nocardia TaxID=2637762 RepID=UPI00367D0789
MTPTPEIVTGAPQPVARRDWTEHVRQIDMPAQQKYCALVLATYADLDGSRVSPGVRRLAAVMDVTERTAVRSINGLQQLGLIRRITTGQERASQPEEYQLTFPAGIEAAEVDHA